MDDKMVGMSAVKESLDKILEKLKITTGKKELKDDKDKS